MAAEVQQLLDKQEIAERLYDYARSMDRIDVALGESVFHADAYADYGQAIFQGSAHEFVGQMCTVVHPNFQTHTHQLSMIRIWLQGTKCAASECHVDMNGRIPNGEGDWNDVRSLGRYIDVWEKRDGAWRIAKRRFVVDFDRIEPAAPLSQPTGTRDRTDPSYFGHSQLP